jgi:hypothetical protein
MRCDHIGHRKRPGAGRIVAHHQVAVEVSDIYLYAEPAATEATKALTAFRCVGLAHGSGWVMVFNARAVGGSSPQL